MDNSNLYYNALLRRDKSYDGKIFVCVKTTKIFCNLSCAARKPLEQNIQFVNSIAEAKAKGFRACLKCRPEDDQKSLLPITSKMIEILRQNPSKKWNGSEIKKIGIDDSTLRRAFIKDFGISFLKFAREHRLGAIVTNIENGNNIINSQLDAGFSSSSGFVDAVKKQIGTSPKNLKSQNILSAKWIETPIGAMLGIVGDDGLHLLEFAERKGLPTEIEATKKKTGPICFRNHSWFEILEKELAKYFSGEFVDFTIPIVQFGTKFEKTVWEELQKVPIGQTRSYSAQAIAIGNPNAIRAVARANGANKVAILIPCHRIIGSNGAMTGYGGKIWRKEWLLKHEKKIKN